MRSLSKLTAFDTQEAFFYIRHVNSPFRIAGRLASPLLSEDVRKGGTKNALCVQDVDCMLDNSKYANNEKCVNLIQNESKLAAVENIAGRRPTTITATTSSTFPKIPQCNFLSLFRERYVAKKNPLWVLYFDGDVRRSLYLSILNDG